LLWTRISEAKTPDLILRLNDVVSGYVGEQNILQGISFDVQNGEVLSIIGPNGAGKSTLFKTIFGAVRTKEGSIGFDGHEIANLSSLERLRRGLLYIPQGRTNFPAMTVRENLEMGAFTRNDNQVKDDIEEVLALFPRLSRIQSEKAGNLSGGQQKMMEIARAVLLKPKLIMADEPSMGLDPQSTSAVFDKLLEINAMGKTLMIVEQNARKALSVSNRALVLVTGKKRFEGSANEIAKSQEVKKLYLGG